MKTWVAAALAMACSAAVALAQGGPVVKVSGLLQTGFQDVTTITSTGQTDEVSLYDALSGNPTRFRIGMSLTTADGDWGITTRLDNEYLSTGGVAPSWNQALVWGTLFERLVTLKAGLLDEEAFSFTWRSWGAELIWGDQFDGNLGAELQLAPLPGLTLGYVFPILGGVTAMDSLKSSYLAAAFEVAGLGRLVGGAQLSPAINSTYAWVGADLAAVQGLILRVAAQAFYIGDTNFSWLQVYQEAGYVFGPLALTLKAWEEAYAAKNSSLAWQAEPTVSYSIGVVTVALTGAAGTLLARDPNPGASVLPFGFAAGGYASFALAPTSEIRLGGRFLMPDISVSSSTVQVFVSFVWSF
jgi:hypothetical protein